MEKCRLNEGDLELAEKAGQTIFGPDFVFDGTKART